MGLFSFTQEVAIDLGTANTIITCNDKMVVDEPSVIALDARSDKVLAVGKVAREMYEKTHPNIRTVRPLREGVIADFYAAEQMIRGFIKMASGRKRWFAPSLRMVIGIPSGSTEVEIRAVRDSAEHAGGRDVYMVFEPMAAAIGVGIDVLAPEGNMIVDIGGGTTEIAVISLGGIVSNKSIRMAGDDLTADIVEYMRRQHNVKVSERMAERIKINVGSALTVLEDAPEDYVVHGPNQMTALPMEVPVSYQEIAHCLDKSISKIEAAILSALEQTPPELYADIVKNGIYLAGGGAMLRGLDKRLRDKMNIQFHIAEDPLHAVAKGTGVALKNIEKFNFLIPMRKLLEFLIGKRHWFLFILLEAVSLMLVYRNNAYQRNIIFSSANVVTGYIASISGSVTSYLNLRDINKELLERNGQLELQMLDLQDQLDALIADTVSFKGFAPDSTEQFPYSFVVADVVNNSVTHLSNYITVDKGKLDGIMPDMGVVSERGVVGIVSTVSDHFSVIIPLLNPKFRLSCKVLGSSYFGSLSWNGRNTLYANLDELPRHVEFQKGDTIVTSGYSAVFPSGIIVGTVADFEKQHDDNFYSLQVELATDFQALNNVRIIKNFRQTEQIGVEQEAKRND